MSILNKLSFKRKEEKMQTTILIFRTSISGKQDLKRIEELLSCYPQIHQWSVDMEDWEKVLRIEGEEMNAGDLCSGLKNIGIQASELE